MCAMVPAMATSSSASSGVHWRGIKLEGEFTFYGGLVIRPEDELVLSSGTKFNIMSEVGIAGNVNEALRRQHTQTQAPAAQRPVLTLSGESELRIEASNEEYVDHAATCSHHVHGNLNKRVSVHGDVIDMRVPGIYQVVYECKLPGNHAVPLTRTITITKPSTDAPILTLLGESLVRFDPEGEHEFVDEGASCTDGEGNCISRSVMISGDIIRLSRFGTYHTLYECDDANGNSATPLLRTVVVEKPMQLHSWDEQYTTIGMEEPLVALVDSFGDAISVTLDSISRVDMNISDAAEVYVGGGSWNLSSTMGNATSLEEDSETGNTHEPLFFSSQFGYSSTTTTTHLHLL